MTPGEPDFVYLEHSPDAVVIVDEGGLIKYANRQIEVLFGFSADELLGSPIEILVPEPHVKAHRAHRTRYRAAPETRMMGGQRVELRGRRADGTDFPVEISLSPITVSSGFQVMACVRDISVRRAAERHARRVSDALDSVREAAFMFDPESLRFSYVNQGAVEQVGYERSELLAGMTPLHFKPEFTRASFRALVDRLVSGERDDLTFTTVHRRKDGTDIDVEVALQLHRSDRHDVGVMVAMARDVTERLAVEERARQDREARRLAEERDRIALDLHDVVIQRLFGAGMRLQSGLSDASCLPERVDETISELDETIEEIRRTIFALTEDAGESREKRLDRLAEIHTGRTGVPVELEISGDLDAIGEQLMTELESTITEALSNVARHAAARSVALRIAIASGELVLEVVDDGVGLPGAAVAGSGLPNMESRAVALGGEFSIGSKRDGGTRLVWRVPAAVTVDGT